MKELGEYLKHTRISNGVSITEAAEDLEFSTVQIENIESGNVKAFKDVYDLKEDIKLYAKYLGLEADEVINEFNDFLFQHTSKISLDDIKSAQKKEETKNDKVKSPYTKEYKEKVHIWPFVCLIVGIILVVLIIYMIISSINKAPARVDELKVWEGEVYEFTN